METPRERGGMNLSHGMKTGRYASVPAGFVYAEYRADLREKAGQSGGDFYRRYERCFASRRLSSGGARGGKARPRMKYWLPDLSGSPLCKGSCHGASRD